MYTEVIELFPEHLDNVCGGRSKDLRNNGLSAEEIACINKELEASKPRSSGNSVEGTEGQRSQASRLR